jgi:hypothetical protein
MKERMKRIINRLICMVMAHDWVLGTSLPEVSNLPSAATIVCKRCGRIHLTTDRVKIWNLQPVGVR